MFIRAEKTPNPLTMKYCINIDFASLKSIELKDLRDAESSPLGKTLLTIEGVSSVYFGKDFVSVTKSEDADWGSLDEIVCHRLDAFLSSGAEALSTPPKTEEKPKSDTEQEFYDAEDQERVETIKSLLEQHVRPAVAADGGDIRFKGYKDGVVYLEMRGACSGCPSSTATLRYGVENLLRHFIPELKEVRPA